MIDFTNISFGRKPHNPARVAQAKPHRMSATAPPPLILPRPKILLKPSLVKNDTLPTCPIAGLINSLRAWAQEQGFDLPTDDNLLLELFAAIAGCDPTPAAIAATNGLVLQDVLEYVQVHGFRIDSQNVVELDFAAIDPSDEAAIKDAINQKGSAYLGITLFEADVTPGVTVWRGTSASAGAEVGGHCIVPPKYRTASTYDSATWGELIDTDHDFLMSRLVEAWAIDWKMAVAPVA
jgi:hypothetical protein